MAGGSNKDLWQFLTAVSVLRPQELVAEEIKRNKDKLLKGLTFYKNASPTGATAAKTKNIHTEFVQKLSKFLGLDEAQCNEFYKLYLLHEYRGSTKDLQGVLSTERHSMSLMFKMRDYYHSERLYLLYSIKHLLSFWLEENHPYVEQYSEFCKPLFETTSFINQIISQYDEICTKAAPTWETHGSLMNDRQGSIWLMQNLKEQCELLEIMLLYYQNCEHSATNLMERLKSFKKQGFGRRQMNKHLIDEVMEPLLLRIGFLQVVLIIEGVDLEDLQTKCQNEQSAEHHIVQSKDFKALDTLFMTMGDAVPQGPLMLIWMVMRQMVSEDDSSVQIRKLGNKALEMRVFEYLAVSLQREPFSGKTMTANICHSVVYGLVCAVLNCFHEDTLGDPQGLYDLASTLLSRPFLAEDFWTGGVGDGLGSLLQSAVALFPLECRPMLMLCKALTKANRTSAIRVVEFLQKLGVYTEFLDRSTEVDPTTDRTFWVLSRERKPFHSGDSPLLPKGTIGQIIPQGDKNVVRWEVRYDGWKVIVCLIDDLLHKIQFGAGMVNQDDIEKVTLIFEMFKSVLLVDQLELMQTLPQVDRIVNLVYQVIHRFCRCNPPPLELLNSCIDVLTAFVRYKPREVWHNVQQTGLLPYLTENIDNLQEVASGSGLNSGAYGSILAGVECTLGKYPVTMAILDLLGSVVQPLNKHKQLSQMMASVLFVTREIFPAFHKWRYYEAHSRELIGQKCLEMFHKILNILGQDTSLEKNSISVRDVCVYSLLFSESGRTLLDIIGTGVDTIDNNLALQGSATEGAGVELILLVRLAFSVLNRLLLLRPTDSPPSPVEHCLSAQPANRSDKHVVATIAQYMYHRHDTRLAQLATVLLKRIAMVFPMSVLACLGGDAEAIKDIFLSRLQASTEDVRLKVVILEFLSVCVETQPGLIEIFLSIQPSSPKKQKRDVNMGKRSCLHTAISLISEKKQGTYHCPSDLLCAVLEFFHALWQGRRETAMTVLRSKDGFWMSVCLSLTRDLPPITQEEDEEQEEIPVKEIKTCAYILRILALEIYSLQTLAVDKTLEGVLEDIVSKGRLDYWSEYLCDLCKWSSTQVLGAEEIVSDTASVKLLLAWRNLMLVLAGLNVKGVTLKESSKSKMLDHLLEAVEVQFISDMTVLQVKLASIASAFYLTLLKNWIGSFFSPITQKNWNPTLKKLHQILLLTCSNSETLIPSVQIGLLGALVHILHHLKANAVTDIEGDNLKSLVPVVCSILVQNTQQLSPTRSMDTGDGTVEDDVKLKLQIACVCLLEELVMSIDTVELWLPIVKQHSVIQCLLASLQQFMQAKQNPNYVQAVLLLFQTFSKYPLAAEALSLNGLTQTTCLSYTCLYTPDDLQHPTPPQQNKDNGSACETATWSNVFRQGIALATSLLTTLRYSYLEDTLNFVGVHQDRMYMCLNSASIATNTVAQLEAVETCRFLCELSHYRREWRLHLPDVLIKLMSSVCMLTQRCVALLIRPKLLQFMLEKKGSAKDTDIMARDKMMAPVARRLSQSSSVDDSETAPEGVQLVQSHLLEIVAWSLAVQKQFSPPFLEILLDQSLDITEYEPLLSIGFATPSVDQETPPSFGSLISCTNMCLRMLGKGADKASPVKTPTPETNFIKWPLIMYVMENSIMLIMSQAMLYIKAPAMSPREKQLLKRELGTELNSVLVGFQRYLRKGPTSPSPGTSKLAALRQPQSTQPTHDQAYFKLVTQFVAKVLR